MPAMLNVRPPIPPSDPNGPTGRARFRLLLTEDRAHAEEHWTRQLPAVLRPMGIDALIASTGQQALDLIQNDPIHAAVIDLATPKSPADAGKPNADTTPGAGGGLWLMQVIQRLPQKPPVVVVNSRSYSQRQVQRLLNQALELGAFSVINRPVKLDALLNTFQRLVERAYNNTWPDGANPPPQ
ncbi:MAG: hypothetical protein AAGA29_02560 [Planctomycetota bacterium]